LLNTNLNSIENYCTNPLDNIMLFKLSANSYQLKAERQPYSFHHIKKILIGD